MLSSKVISVVQLYVCQMCNTYASVLSIYILVRLSLWPLEYYALMYIFIQRTIVVIYSFSVI